VERQEAPAPGRVLVLGLGNPGPRYAQSRHNLGATVVSELARRHGVPLGPGGKAGGAGGTARRGRTLRSWARALGGRRSLQSLWGRGRVGERPVILALPQTYMNASGRAARALLRYFDLGPENLVAVHDDLDLPLGRLKVVVKGGSGGHKGVASLQAELGSERFVRLKLGIGRPERGESVEDYVLGRFYPHQRERVVQMVHMAADCLEVILGEGAHAAMQKFHTALKEEVEG